jgi:uncharacterized membrane protein YjgN (DUF898 family)
MADTCPRCGFADIHSDKCPQCGVLVPLYKVALEKFHRRSAAGVDATAAALAQPAAPRPPEESRASVAAEAAASVTRELGFHGRGGTLFGIHVVNVCFTLATLGVYAFSAKVRVRRYLLAQSALDGDRFAYHGTGPELLRGFVKALLIFFLPVVLVQLAAALAKDQWMTTAASLLTSALIVLLAPLGVVAARRYRLSRTSWRAIRFSFDGRVREYATLFLKASLLMPLTLGLYYPIFHARSHAFLVSHSRFGQRAFGFDGTPRDTLRPFLVAVVLVLPTLGMSLLWHLAWRRRYYWAHTTFDRARFRCIVTGGQLLRLWVVNVLLLLVTLGLAWPWVRVRNARFALNTLVLEGPVDVAAVVQTAPTASATGDAVSSFFGAGFEIGA